MIVSFSVSNFRSFSSEETFSLVASNRLSGNHDSHAIPIPGSDENVLRIAVLYGANGAGKSNLFKAFQYLKSVAVEPREKNSGTGRQAFRFAENAETASSFDLQFVAEEKLYRFGFKVNDQRITEEWLVRMEGNREKALYERVTDEAGKVTIAAQGLKDAGEKLRALATVGGPENQSFLATIYVTLNAPEYGDELHGIFAWFRRSLQLIEPGTSSTTSTPPVGHLLAEDTNFKQFADAFLKSASTGVDHLSVIKSEITEDELRSLLPEDIFSRLLKELRREDAVTGIVESPEGIWFSIQKADKNHYYRITVQAAHENATGNVIPLELKEESDGTRRLLDLIPALHHMQTKNAVYFIDEIDRSLHPILVFKFLEFFLKSCGGEHRQVIVTTHESNLLDLDLLRRDEIWFAEKDQQGASHLYSLADFKVRKDLEIRKHYLQGRFGAVPFLGDLDRMLEEQSKRE